MFYKLYSKIYILIPTFIALTFDSYKNVNDELVDWLNGRLRQNSLCVKLKVRFIKKKIIKILFSI